MMTFIISTVIGILAVSSFSRVVKLTTKRITKCDRIFFSKQCKRKKFERKRMTNLRDGPDTYVYAAGAWSCCAADHQCIPCSAK